MTLPTIGMIGYGGIGRVHGMAYRSLPFHYGLPADAVRIGGVATTRAETAQTAAAELGCDFWTADYRELLANPAIDAVDICVPNHMHAAIVEAAAAAGKHIYCEKPLAMNVAEGQRMVAAAARAGVKTQMTFNFRYYPAVLRARQLVETGFLGRIFSFRGRYYRSSYIDPNKPISWRQQKAIAGGGTLFDIGSHILDMLYYLLGEFASVQATLDTLIKERPASAGATERVAVDVDDIALLTLRTRDGVPGVVDASRMGTGLTNDIGFELFGEQGAIRFNALDPAWLEVYDGRDPDKPTGGMRGFRKIETVSRYAGQKSPDWSMTPDLADGLHIQAVMAAAEQSSAEGRWVRLDEVLA
jgi:predicted dehydrogenase